MNNNKSLGQHWLKDASILEEITECGDINRNDTVLEIGPGLGTLTSRLLNKAKQVIAVEFDQDLAQKLPGQFPGKNLAVVNQDFLDYDLSNLPNGYKVVANIPYYITAKIINKLLNDDNKPSKVVLLVQKEVAVRLAAEAGNMSLLSIGAQIHAKVLLGPVVESKYFTPPPKVDSQVVILDILDKSLIDGVDEKEFFRIVKAGFSAKRKKLRSSLSGGLGMPKAGVEIWLGRANIDPNKRAEDLSIDDWIKLESVAINKEI